jgi:long-chain acyl-CoA synthetase
MNKETHTVDKRWLKSYPPGVPAVINPDAYQSLVEIFDSSCQRYSEKPAFYSMGKTMTFSQLHQLSTDFAAYLQNDLGLKKGDRIAIMLPNILQYPVAMFAALKAGLVIVNVNPLYTADELGHQLKDSGAETILVLSNFAHTVEKAAKHLPQLKNIIITDIGDLLPKLKGWAMHFVLKYFLKKIPEWSIPKAIAFKTAIKDGHHQAFKPVELKNTDIAFLQYTGGTTGVSKGAVLTHRNMITNLQQADVWFKDLFKPGEEIMITALPLYHIFSLMANCLLFVKMGGLNVLIVNPRDIAAMIKDMKRFKFTAITGVNTLFNGLLKDPDFAKLDFSRLRLTLGGGMAVQRVVAEEWQRVTGKPLLEAYGLTETSPCVTINPDNLKSYNGSIGLPVPSTEVAILDDEGMPVPADEPGELAVKGPQVMQGYWNNPAETAKVFTADGWLLTGDIASMDEDGYIKILERKKDMILVSGFNVYPNEIEGVLATMPGIRECAIIGVPDENSGEAVKAYIVVDDPAITAHAVTRFCREHLTPYKVPKQIEFCEELPKTNVGKILRRALRDKNNNTDAPVA